MNFLACVKLDVVSSLTLVYGGSRLIDALKGAWQNATGDEVMSEMLDAMITYARLGLPVLPLIPGKKEPLCTGVFQHGFKDATTDEALIRACLAAYPNANAGIRMGVVREDGTAVGVIDEDNKDTKGDKPAKDGRADIDELEARLGPLPRTYTVNTTSINSETGNRGKQYYFIIPNELLDATLKGQLAYGVDLKIRDCYVVAPPSVVNGRTYEADGILGNFAEMPAAWAAACIKPPLVITRTPRSSDGETICTCYGIDMFDVLTVPPRARKSADWYVFGHPIHDSTSGTNLHVRANGGGWKCWRHDTSGDALTWVAVREGFIDCAQAGPLDAETVKQCVAVLRGEGKIREDKPNDEPNSGPRRRQFGLKLRGSGG